MPQAVRRPPDAGQDDDRRRQTHRPLHEGAGDFQTGSPLGHDRPFGCLHANAKECGWLQGPPIDDAGAIAIAIKEVPDVDGLVQSADTGHQAQNAVIAKHLDIQSGEQDHVAATQIGGSQLQKAEHISPPEIERLFIR